MLPAIQALLSFGCLFLGGAALLLLSVLGAFHAARRATWKHVKALPGPDGSIPLLWIVRQHFRIARVKHMVPYNPSAMETHLGICSQYRKKGLYRFYVGNQLHVMIFKPELIESVLTSQKTMSKSFNYSLLHSWLGTGLLTSSGAKWKQRRRMLTPAFHFRILEDFVAPMNEHARNMGKRISQFSESDKTDVVPFLAACTLEILLETIMGVTTGKYREDIGSYIDAIKYLTEQVVARSNTPWLQLDSIYLRTDAGLEYKRRVSVVHDFTKKVIANRREELVRETRTVLPVSTNGDEFREKRRLTFIDILLHHSLDFDALLKDEDIREEVDTFMFEGHDTTTMAVAWCLYLIGLHRQVQTKVQEELDDVLGGEPDRNIMPEDMKKLKYMDCVIKEATRFLREPILD